jgi:hypothetical protein
LERAVIHLAHHNFQKKFRTKGRDEFQTHAEVAGLGRERILEFRSRTFTDRAFGWRSNLEQWQLSIWNREVGVPVHRVTPLAKHLLTA